MHSAHDIAGTHFRFLQQPEPQVLRHSVLYRAKRAQGGDPRRNNHVTVGARALRIQAARGHTRRARPLPTQRSSFMELVSGSSFQPAERADLLDTAAQKLGRARGNLRAGYTGPLTPHDQGAEERCVAASMCTGLLLRAICTAGNASTLQFLNQTGNTPSIAHAYHAQRVEECEVNRRCDCGPMCGGLCDPRCGTVLSVMVSTCKKGIVPASVWPSAAARDTNMPAVANRPDFLTTHPLYRLNKAEFIPIEELSTPAVLNSVRSMVHNAVPVLLNMYVYTNHTEFYRAQHDVEPNDSVYADAHTMPLGTGLPGTTGHCMLIVGYDDSVQKLRVRNSFGPNWGCHGDFALPYAAMSPRYVHALVGILDVSLLQPE